MSDKITIRRAKHDKDNPYFLMRRDTAQDHGISAEALGILTEILSRPDDWRVSPDQLSNRVDTKRARVYRILKELIAAQYIERIYHRDSHGRVQWVEYVVHECPLLAKDQQMVKQDVVKQDVEIQHNTYKRVVQDTEVTKNSVDANASTSGDSSVTTLPKQKAPKKAKPKTVIPRSELSEPDALYETIERQLFDTESLPDAPYLWDMPIGQITRWLKGEIEKVRGAVVGKISAPAQPHHIALFTAWYRGKYSDAAYPQEFSKFVKHWRAFASEQNRKAQERAESQARYQREADAIEAAPQLTPEERVALSESLRAFLRDGKVDADGE